MKENDLHLPQKDGTADDGRFYWNGYSFPLLPTLLYQADGPDKRCPDRLFIVDRQGRFRFYFERDGEDLWETCSRHPGWDTLVVEHHSRRLQLCYPLQGDARKPAAGYFRVDFLEDGSTVDSCSGSLSISLPEPYFDSLRKFTDLRTLLTGLTAEKWKGGDGCEQDACR